MGIACVCERAVCDNLVCDKSAFLSLLFWDHLSAAPGFFSLLVLGAGCCDSKLEALVQLPPVLLFDINIKILVSDYRFGRLRGELCCYAN